MSKGKQIPASSPRSLLAAAVASLLIFAASSGRSDPDAAAAASCRALQSDESISPFAGYRERIEALRKGASERGSIRYTEVLRSIYEDEMDELLAQKLRWQTQHSDAFLFYSDYRSIDEAVALSVFQSKRNPRLGSTLVGRYEANSNTIEIAHDASAFVVIHESGHTLQRQCLIHDPHDSRQTHGASAESHQLTSLFQKTASSKRDQLRLRYLAAQEELEVRLQDLNRFYANCTDGRPIASPIEALQALDLLGLKLDQETVHAALQGTDWEQEPGEIETLLAADSPYSKSQLKSAFEDACELLLLQKLVLRHQPEAWTLTLRKLLFEAPGHL
ncbi:hypothetical protein [Pelagicoccus sp. SDUM812003]|uniref:hypothetical protein n=1 Tax=Pelagicoccus sp. SDUM812003 TaxID=3041267 RepID=UPI00280F7D63|nr:hypothetical protein [Pelagicoccus sp. SDUM812003]MDQ8204016.1 hypothetical protein [Pelagicoccus sp. SDUM812003]